MSWCQRFNHSRTHSYFNATRCGTISDFISKMLLSASLWNTLKWTLTQSDIFKTLYVLRHTVSVSLTCKACTACTITSDRHMWLHVLRGLNTLPNYTSAWDIIVSISNKSNVNGAVLFLLYVFLWVQTAALDDDNDFSEPWPHEFHPSQFSQILFLTSWVSKQLCAIQRWENNRKPAFPQTIKGLCLTADIAF